MFDAISNQPTTTYLPDRDLSLFKKVADGKVSNGFQKALEEAGESQSSTPSKSHGPSLEEAAHKMEVQLTMLMLKTMEKSSTEGGLLGNQSQGMGYFKDLFLEEIAENIVANTGSGFAEALKNTHKAK